MQIRIIDNTKEDYEKWDKYVISSSKTNFFHLSGWAKVVADTYAHKPVYIIAEEGSNISGILPLFFVNSLIFGRILASGIFTSFAGLIADNKKTADLLLNFAINLSDSLGYKYLEIKNLEKLDLSNNDQSLIMKDIYCTLFVDLTNGYENIWDAWPKERRRMVRRAKDANIVVHNSVDYLDDFYNLVAFEKRRLGSPVHKKDFYKNILKYFPDEVNLFAAKVDDVAIYSVMTATFKDKIHAYTSGSNNLFKKFQPSVSIYWEIMQYAVNEKLKIFDFGRSTWNSGTYKFKELMGAQAYPLYYYYHLNNNASIPNFHQDNKKLHNLIEIWKKVPLSVTKIIGPYLIKNIV